MRYVIQFSGGAASYCAAKRVIAAHTPHENISLLFCDTLTEDWDLYRFIEDAKRVLALPLIRLCDGRNIWRVFRDQRYLGNSRVDPCSKILKRELADRWFKEHYTPDEVVRVVGFDWTEGDRYDTLRRRLAPWRVEAPLMEKPLLSKCDMFNEITTDGIAVPRLYRLGSPHNNCGGGCIKAGQAQFAWLLRTLPDVYAEWQKNETAMRTFLDKDVAILKDRRNGRNRPMPLSEFSQRVTAGDFDEHEWGGCACFLEPDSEDE